MSLNATAKRVEKVSRLSDTEKKAYIGISGCGCITFALVAGIETPAQERKEIKKVLASGRKVEVTTVEKVRANKTFLNCPHQHQDFPDKEDHEQIAESLVAEVTRA
jgi:hypothetical protein